MTTEHCPRCSSNDVATGVIMSGRHPAYYFLPNGLRWWSFRAWLGVRFYPSTSNACLSCGLVWSHVSPKELSAFIERNGTAKTKARQALLKGHATDSPEI